MWVKIDDHFDEHDKTLDAGPLGMAFHVAALCYCNRQLTDGFIRNAKAKNLLDLEGMADPSEVIDRLVRVGLWERVEGGFQIHDYLDYQPSREKVLAERERKSVAGKKGAEAKHGAKQSAKQPAKDSAKQEPKQKDGPVPDTRSRSLSVVPESNNTSGGGEEAAKARAKTIANVTIALGREGFDPHDLTEPLNALEAELIAHPGRVTSHVAWTRTLAEKARDARLAAERAKEPRYRTFDGEKQIDRRDGHGWVRAEEEVSA